MKAVKAVLIAEDQLAAVYAVKVNSRTSKKKINELMDRTRDAKDGLDAARAHLRTTHAEVLKEEYGS